MSLYAERVFPHLMNRVMDTNQTRAVRADVCAGLAGDVVEIGFGTGHNLPYLPDAVTSLRVVEPSGVGVRLAASRIAASRVPVSVEGLDGQALPFPDGSADMVLRFAEHGRAPDASVLAWQRRLNPVQKRVGAGCHLDRDIPALLAAGGLEVTALTHRYEEGVPRVVGSLYTGEARSLPA